MRKRCNDVLSVCKNQVGARPTKVDPLAHALRLTAVLPSGLMLMDKSMQKKLEQTKQIIMIVVNVKQRYRRQERTKFFLWMWLS